MLTHLWPIFCQKESIVSLYLDDNLQDLRELPRMEIGGSSKRYHTYAESILIPEYYYNVLF